MQFEAFCITPSHRSDNILLKLQLIWCGMWGIPLGIGVFMEEKWRNPDTEELYIHKEKGDKRELLYGIHKEKGSKKGHAVWREDKLDYHRDENGNISVDGAIERRQARIISIESGRDDIERGKESTQKHMEEKHQQLEQDIKDKKIIAETATKARVDGTTEGMDKVQKRVQEAGKDVERKAQKDHGELKEIHQKEAQEREKNLQERKKKTEADKKDIRQAFSKVETKAAKNQLKEAEQAAQDDAQYIEGQRKDQEKRRKTSEKKGAKQEADIKAVKVDFKK